MPNRTIVSEILIEAEYDWIDDYCPECGAPLMARDTEYDDNTLLEEKACPDCGYYDRFYHTA